ncbi:MAG: hypothetical protein ACR5K4_01365 [Sodalis sp. (in: enterobacteria)]
MKQPFEAVKSVTSVAVILENPYHFGNVTTGKNISVQINALLVERTPPALAEADESLRFLIDGMSYTNCIMCVEKPWQVY